MRITTTLAGESRHTTFDALMKVDLQCLFCFWIENPDHRDFARSYALLAGVEMDFIDNPTDTMGTPVGITFVDLPD